MDVPKTPFIMSMCERIAKMMRQKGVWPDCTAEDIHASADRYEQIPNWNRDALAYLKEGRYYYSLDEVQNPTEGMLVHIRHKGYIMQHVYRSGVWKEIGDIKDM
ncbi:hypothetical protein [Paenibacillus sp. Marseille-Q4541]|uniref:hypothetical protein n=1 Tax=Paenibacillus sp. Marseille-Q4541 TaxID=2831522 RepID=UPI001BA77E92|nr:hypothetical protein [Paenibacillus sp. Marseille-Q4541]